MRPSKFQRRPRALRLGLIGLMIGAALEVGPLIFWDFVTLVSSQYRPIPSRWSDVVPVLAIGAVLALISGASGFVMGYLTARIKARIWAWRLCGGLCIIVALALGLDAVYLSSKGAITTIGLFVGIAILIGGTVIGIGMISAARAKVADD